ncbi:MAG: hypothetical protein OES24_13395 [Acidimicrobiia bacterium]|nr:hypothetical protein [Acidimicrobiia bacterium]
MAVEPNLVQLGQGVYAFTHPDPRFGHSNVGLVIDQDGLTLIDTTATPAQAEVTARAVDRLAGELGLPIKRVVLTSSRVAFSGGSGIFWSAAFYGTEVTSEQLDAPANPPAFRALLPHLAASYPDDFTTRPITHTVNERAQLTGAIALDPLTGESAGNLVAFVESAKVVFAGAFASFGVTPLGHDAYPTEWIAGLRGIAGAGVTVVPGHGPVGGAADVEDLIAYLEACLSTPTDRALPSGPWDRWTDRRFDPVNVDRARLLAAGRDEPPASMFALLGL